MNDFGIHRDINIYVFIIYTLAAFNIYRYCGYCAWRGVLDASTEEGTKIKAALRKVYPDLGHCLYFHINVAENTHAVLYELTRERLNWLWYVNQPEPNLKARFYIFHMDCRALVTLILMRIYIYVSQVSGRRV